MLWTHRYLTRIDFRMVFVTLALMLMSTLVISSHSLEGLALGGDLQFFTPQVKKQLQWFVVGGLVYILAAGFDYHKLREWTWILYLLLLISLVGLFFTDSIQRVHRWYRLPFMSVQPGEAAKLIVVMALSWFLEKNRSHSRSWSTAFYSSLIVAVPFILILKQPDLGTAMVLYPITCVMFYFGNLHPFIVRSMAISGLLALFLVLLIFLKIVPYAEVEPYASKVLRSYQVERLNPDTHHQRVASTAIAIGGLTGGGWGNSEFSNLGWLPASYTDSVFAAFSEDYGFVGALFMMLLFYALIYFGFQVTAIAKDHFGRLLSAGITVYLAMHVLFNIGMMCGFLPITGVPLVLVSYGGSSMLATMVALGLLQSIYSRRFMF